jgi:hypothetical protein
LQAAAQVGGLADIGFGLGISATKQEYGRCGRGSGECFRLAIRVEIQMLGQHKGILV